MLLNTTSYINDHTQFVTSHQSCNNANTILCEIQTKPLLGHSHSRKECLLSLICSSIHPHISAWPPSGEIFITFFSFMFDGNMHWSIMQMEYTVAFP